MVTVTKPCDQCGKPMVGVSVQRKFCDKCKTEKSRVRSRQWKTNNKEQVKTTEQKYYKAGGRDKGKERDTFGTYAEAHPYVPGAIDDIVRRAKAAGMTYGKYVATYRV